MDLQAISACQNAVFRQACVTFIVLLVNRRGALLVLPDSAFLGLAEQVELVLHGSAHL
jgi:hypothetical protein